MKTPFMFQTTAVMILATLMCLSVVSPADAAPGGDHRRAKKFHKPLKALPKGHYHQVVHRGKPYFLHSGRFYRHLNGVYVSITAPIGAIIPVLPGGYITVGIGASRYFHYGGVYYRRAPNGYVVITNPTQAQTVPASLGSNQPIIYPADGQSEEQKGRDKYECHEWAVGETNFDPTDSSSDPQMKVGYQRAMDACLEARKYVVK